MQLFFVRACVLLRLRPGASDCTRTSTLLIRMSLAKVLKRALVSTPLALAHVYALDLNLTRASPDEDVKRAFHRVMLKAHPDKPGSSEAHAKRLNEAWAKWWEAGRTTNKGGRPRNENDNGSARAAEHLAHKCLGTQASKIHRAICSSSS